ncbi:MAG: helix-turn-helix domain-containing protein [Caldimonas sp.]
MPTQDDKQRSSAAGEVRLPIGSVSVRALLQRHGIPSVRHVTTVAEILGVGYTMVYRRWNGAVAWEIEEIEKVAGHFGESLAEVFAARSDERVPGVLVAGAARIRCQLAIGGAVRQPAPDVLVAVRVGDQWMAVPGVEAPSGDRFTVRELVVSGDTERARRIAVLDDDPDESRSLADHFSLLGCEAQAFTQVDELVAAMRLRPFDGFVVDWVLSEGSAGELVAMIRASDPECPIAILTGKLEADLDIERDVAGALSTYQLLFFEKPTRLAIISSQLLRAVENR